jgi:nifR3 family TIM-barrel protein
MRQLTDPWQLGPIEVPNRVLLAPLAGIGTWVMRLQAARFGAGMAVSEMVSSFGIHHGNPKTPEMLRTHPDEGLLAVQLFGQDPDVMRSAAAHVAEHVPQARVIDLNMGCPVPKVFKTGAGAAMLKDPDTAVAVARAAREGSGLPVTVKLRSGTVPGDTTSGYALAHRLVDEAGVSAIGFHPRSAKVHHKGTPDLDLAAKLVASLGAPVVLTGGLHTAQDVRRSFEHTGAAAVMLARGIMGNPWLFAQVLGEREDPPSRDEVLAEHAWYCARCVEHLGPERGARYLRKAHPWYVEQLGLDPHEAKALNAALQSSTDAQEAVELLRGPAVVA